MQAFIQSKIADTQFKAFSNYAALQRVVGKWYTRAPIAQSDKSCTSTTATRSTMEEEGNYDDSEDESRL